jgi:hypothetical protein
VRWFKHQTAAHNDAKMKRLIMRQGMAAYGLYWYCLELIGKDVSESRLTFVIEEDSELLAHATGMTREQVEQAMRCMVDLGLFENVEGKISCLNMLRHMDASMFKAGEVRDRFQKKKTEILTHQERDALTGTCTAQVPDMYGTSTVRGEQDRTGQDITEQDINTRSPDGDHEPPFDRFWFHWPKKKHKPAAKKAFQKAGVSPEILINDIKKRIGAGQWSLDDKQWIPDASTYLNQRGWEDEVIPRSNGSSRSQDLERQHAEVLSRHLTEEDTLWIEKN